MKTITQTKDYMIRIGNVKIGFSIILKESDNIKEMINMLEHE